MRQHRSLLLLVTGSLLVGLAGCAGDSMKSSEPPPPSPVAQAQEGKDQPATGEIQERAVPRIAPGVVAPPPAGMALPPPVLPGEFAILTAKGYLRAMGGGGRRAEPVFSTNIQSAFAETKFRLAPARVPSAQYKTIQTWNGNYVTAQNGGGLNTNALRTDLTQPRELGWEGFHFLDLNIAKLLPYVGSIPAWYAIQTVDGHYFTAVGGGGQLSDAIHTDTTQVNMWEAFRPVKCGDLGSGYRYAIVPYYTYSASNPRFANAPMLASQGGGLYGTILCCSPARDANWTRFRFIRQGDGSYAFQTSDGQHYVTALGGGGQTQQPEPRGGHCVGECLSAIFHTDATQVQAWEKFRVLDQGDCTYAIQTSSGRYLGMYYVPNAYSQYPGPPWAMSTDKTAISDTEKFTLVPYDLEL